MYCPVFSKYFPQIFLLKVKKDAGFRVEINTVYLQDSPSCDPRPSHPGRNAFMCNPLNKRVNQFSSMWLIMEKPYDDHNNVS